MRCLKVLLLALVWGGMAVATVSDADAQQFHTVQVPLAEVPLKIEQATHSETPFTVAGPQGAVLGQQSGSFEAWVWPMKVLSHMHITAHLRDYDVPIDINQQSASIDVRPDRTVITYSHAAIVVRQIMFAPHTTEQSATEDGTGVVVLFQIEAVRPGTLTFDFTPELRRMWPAPNYGVPSAEWVPRTSGGGGFYVLHTDMPQIAAALTIPGAEPGILAPYQEKPQVYPLTMTVAFDPVRDRNVQFPLLIVAANGTVPQADAASSVPQLRSGSTAEVAEAHPLNGSTPTGTAALGAELLRLNDAIPQLYKQTAEYWQAFLATHVRAETPDSKLNDALQWAEVSIEQSQVRYKPVGDAQQGMAETGMVAGYFSSGDSARPGFAWFFGRDTLWTMFAIDSYGDFDLARKAFDFLFARQRADGKVMHEFSQTADEVDWKAFPYQYAAADATPLLIMAVNDFVSTSGDRAFLQQHWLQIKQAWQFESTHDANGDGIYDNAQGTGWVESWPPTMPKQEIYLAALDEQASGAMAQLAAAMGDAALSRQAEERGKHIAATMQREYAPTIDASIGTGSSMQSKPAMWAFSWNGTAALNAGGQDTTATIYPSVAWWDGTYALPNAEGMFARWASPEFSTGWGLRDVGKDEKLYDPISYHQGTVWPLFTGWASLAEYRFRKPLAGYQHLMQNVDLTYAQDLGAVTELLSGEFNAPLGRSTSHQMWSSAMVISPAMRGLFGIRVDAGRKTVWADPQLPSEWPGATVHNLNLGGTLADLKITAPQHCAAGTCRAKVTLLNAPVGWKTESSHK